MVQLRERRLVMSKNCNWYWDYSPAKRRAWIVDEEGYTVIDAVLSKETAKEICRAHNMIISDLIWKGRNNV